MATAELAIALPSLVALGLLCVGLLGAAAGVLRSQDAARVAARSLARGDPAATAVALARAEAPAGASVSTSRTASGADPLVRVTVTAPVRMAGPLGRLLPVWHVTGSASALNESVPAG